MSETNDAYAILEEFVIATDDEEAQIVRADVASARRERAERRTLDLFKAGGYPEAVSFGGRVILCGSGKGARSVEMVRPIDASRLDIGEGPACEAAPDHAERIALPIEQERAVAS